MNDRVRRWSWTGLLAGLTAAVAAPTNDAPWVFGTARLAAQTIQQEEMARFIEARRAINAEEFERAAALFQAIRTESARTSPPFEPDSYYWEAFARYRLGDLAEARLLLETLMIGFPEAHPADRQMRREAGRLYHDARALEFEIRSQLASSGDAGEAERLLREAEATLQVAPTIPRLREMPIVAEDIVSLPLSVVDLAVSMDSVVAHYTMADGRARADSLAAALRERPQTADQEPLLPGVAPVQGVAPGARYAADWDERAAEYRREAAEYQREAAAYQRDATVYELQAEVYDWERREYQEAARAAQERGTCDDVSVQLAALEAVMRHEINRMQVLRGVLARADECATRLHEEAVGLIGREETLEAQMVLINVIRDHRERSVRRAALQELWRFDSLGAFRVLQATLADSDDDTMQSDAINGLRRSRYAADASAATAIQNALSSAVTDDSKRESVRSGAIRALRDRDHVEGAVFIRIYAQLDSDDLKETLLRSLASKVREKEDMETAAWARSVAFDPEVSSDVRGAAFSAWAAHPTVTVAYLEDLYGQLSEAFLKRQAIYAIYQRAESDSSAPGVLMELIRNEPDHEVRERGIYWLGRTGSDEVVDFLLELLRPAATDTVPTRRLG